MIIMYCAEVLISSRLSTKMFGPTEMSFFCEMFSCHKESEPAPFRKRELLCSLCYHDRTLTEIYIVTTALRLRKHENAFGPGKSWYQKVRNTGYICAYCLPLLVNKSISSIIFLITFVDYTLLT